MGPSFFSTYVFLCAVPWVNLSGPANWHAPVERKNCGEEKQTAFRRTENIFGTYNEKVVG